MNYALTIGLRYLRSKKKKTVSVITFIAVAGVALGVAALLTVMSITSGFQLEFRIADMEKLARVGLGADRDTELRQPLTLGRFRRIVEVDLHERT